MKMKPRYFWMFLLVLIAIFCCTYLLTKKSHNQNKWQFFIKNQVGAKSALNVGRNLSFDEKRVYFCDGLGLIHALNKKTGEIDWLSQLSDHTPFEITQDQEALFVSNFNSHIYKIDKQNGYILWSFSIPNQFWPDTEVVFDDNDQYVFFADRGGFLYALDKKTGQEMWKRELGTIDNTKAFKEGSIHFGFLKQNDENIIVDHFPNKKRYSIDKQTGDILKEEIIQPVIELGKEKTSLQFSPYNLTIQKNVAKQPQLNLFDQQENLLWSYQTEQQTNIKEIYQNEDRVYFLDINNQLLSSIKIGNEDPTKPQFKKINFKIKEDPYIAYVVKSGWQQKIKNTWLFLRYFSQNIQQVAQFELKTEEKDSYLELSLIHQQNFYKNVFTDVEIETTFINQYDKDEKFRVKGFYYDYNLWKVRARLTRGVWKWEIKIKTPFLTKKQSGVVEIKNDSEKSLKIKDKNLVTNNDELFFPIGIQDAIVDNNADGNCLNQMNVKAVTLPSGQTDHSYLNFPDYLDLYQKEAPINLFRYGPDNWSPKIWVNLASTKTFTMSINGNFQGDTIIDEAKKRNMKLMMSVFSFSPPYSSKEAISKKSNRKIIIKYLDYVIARYASNIDIWELSNEAFPSIEWQNFISDYLAKNDPYKHPITTNFENTKLNNSNLLSIHIYAHPKNNFDLLDYINKNFKKPITEDWQGAMMVSELGFSDSNFSAVSANFMRKIMWILAFKQTGIVYWNFGDVILQNNKTPNIYIGLKEYHLNELQKFLSGLQIPSTSKFEIISNNRLAVYQLENKNTKLFYLINMINEMTMNFDLPISVDENSLVQMVDPKSNTTLKEMFVNQKTKTIQLPRFYDDLAIKIIKI